jgi:undecaprenyl-diphosphatase
VTFLQILSLAVLQGFTEFLPISSSAHLILMPRLAHWQDQGLSFDIAVHVGTLLAVVLYFRHTLVAMVRQGLPLLAGKPCGREGRLGWQILVATLPVVIAGMFAEPLAEHALREPMIIALASIFFGVLLLWSDQRRGSDSEYDLSWRNVLIIGMFQMLALIPGTSRSGIVITAGLLLGLSRTAASRFAFLLAIPVILAAGVYNSLLLMTHEQAVDWQVLWVGALVSAVTAYLCIHFFLKLIQRIGMAPFVIYRIVLGIALIAVWS